MSITTSAIIAEYGAFYQDAGQNKKRILSMLSQGRQITTLATPIKTDDTIFRLANATFRTLVQPFQKAFTQKGGVNIVRMKSGYSDSRLTMSLCLTNSMLPGWVS